MCSQLVGNNFHKKLAFLVETFQSLPWDSKFYKTEWGKFLYFMVAGWNGRFEHQNFAHDDSTILAGTI